MISNLVNKATYIFMLFMVISISAFGQEKLGNEIYTYADVKSSINGKTILINKVGYTYEKMINLLKKEGIDAMSSEPEIELEKPWSVHNGSHTDVIDLINKNDVQTILLIRLNRDLTNAISNRNPIFDDYEGPIKSDKKYNKIVKNVELLFEVYRHKNEPKKTLVVLNLKSQSEVFLTSTSKGYRTNVMDKKSKAVFKILKVVLKRMKREQKLD